MDEVIYHLKKAVVMAKEKDIDLLGNGVVSEILLSIELGHEWNNQHKHHDASDEHGRKFEYKIGTRKHWSFPYLTSKTVKRIRGYDGVYLALRKDLEITDIWFLHDMELLKSYMERKVRASKSTKDRVTVHIYDSALEELNAQKVK